MFERRAALTPTTSKRLIEAGFKIIVERDQQRIFDDSEYEKYVLFTHPIQLFPKSLPLESAVNW